MIKKHENKEGKNPIDVFVGSLFVNRNDVKIVSISNNNAGIKLSDGDLVVPLYLKLETLFDKEITDLKLEQMIEDTVSLFSELEDKIIEHYFHSFSLFDFDLDFINALFSEIKINYLIDYFVKDNLELESEKVIKLDGKKDLPSFGIVIHLTNNQSKNIINSIISYLLKQVDTNCLLSQIIQKIKNNSSNHNRSFFNNSSDVDNWGNSIRKRTITLFEKLSFDEQVLFISKLEKEFYLFENPQVLSFLMSDLFHILEKNKRFKKRKESLLADNDFIDSLITCSAVILLSKQNDVIHRFANLKNNNKELFRFLFVDNQENAQVLLFNKLKSILSKGFNCVYLDNFLLFQLLLSDNIVVGFEDNFIHFLNENLNLLSIYDDDTLSSDDYYYEYSMFEESDWMLGSSSIKKAIEAILNKIRTDAGVSSVLKDEWVDD